MGSNNLDVAHESISFMRKLRFPSFWQRLFAYLLDLVALVPLMLLSQYSLLSVKSLSLSLLTAILSGLYKPLMEWKFGATLGKMGADIKVVSSQLGPISGNQTVKRSLPFIIGTIIAIPGLFYVHSLPEFSEVTDFIQMGELISTTSPYVPYQTLYSAVFLILAASILMDKQNRGFHDVFADTYCIKGASLDNYFADPSRPSPEEILKDDRV